MDGMKERRGERRRDENNKQGASEVEGLCS